LRTVRYDRKKFLSLLLTSIFFFAPVQAGSAPEIKVRKVEPVLRDGKLYVNIRIDNLFTRKVIGTIQSGLPSAVLVEIQLLEKGRRKVAQKQIVQSISYNIWEERYTIVSDSTSEKLRDFDRALERGSAVENAFIVDARFLQPETTYILKVQVEISPISSLQTQKLSDWLQESDETQSEIVSGERSSGFKFNLSKLVSFLVGGNSKSANSSPGHKFEFRLADLQK
jgi:hypothetical protein